MAVRWPLVGRMEEMRFLTDTIRRTGDSRGAILVGAAGVGKTRLAQEVFEQSRRSGVVARWVTATASARTVPLGAFALVLPSVGSDPLRALDQAVSTLLAGAERGTALIVVDDGHLLDDVSATLVHQLVLGGLATVVITTRAGEATPDAVTALWKDGHLDRVPVPALSPAETGQLLETMLGGPVDGASAQEMWRLANGNALYVRELLGGERTAGRWARHDGTWHWSGGLALTADLVELVENRMGSLGGPVSDVVDVLSIAGLLELSVLAGLVAPDAVEAAEAAGLVTAECTADQLTVRLAHPLYGEVRSARTGVLRARRLRGRIARALLAAGDPADELRCATLLIDSDLAPEPRLLLRAATRSAELLDLPLAVRLARAAVAAGCGFAAQGILVEALSLLGQGEQATEELAGLTELATSDQEVAWATTVRAGNLFWTLNDPDQAETALATVLRQLTDEPAQHMLLAMRATFAAFRGHPDQALRDADTVLAAGREMAPNTVLFASWGRTIALGVTGQPGTAEAAATGYASTRFYDTAMLRFLLAEAEITGLLLAGRLDAADATAARCRTDSANLPGVPLLMTTALTGQLHLAHGRLQDAADGLRRAIAGFTTSDPGGRVFDCWLWLTRALAMAGDAAGARHALDEMDRHHHPAFGFRAPDVILSRAWVAAAHGALSEAVTLAHRAGRTAREHGMPASEVAALHTAVRFGDRTTALRLADIARRVTGPRAPAAAAHAAAVTTGDSAALRAVSATFEEMGDLLAAADAAAQAATLWQRHDRPGAAHIDAARAHQLARHCQGARTPAIAGVRALPITPREREIITLAGHGLSNRDIASRLGVSVRTVEGHLYRASTKLGVTHRTHLARLLHEP